MFGNDALQPVSGAFSEARVIPAAAFFVYHTLIHVYTYLAVIFFEGSVTEPRRTFVTDLCNKTRWLVTHPSLHTLVTHQTAWLAARPSLHTPMHAQTLSNSYGAWTSLQTSLRSRYIPRYRRNPSPGQQPPCCRSLACVEKLQAR